MKTKNLLLVIAAIATLNLNHVFAQAYISFGGGYAVSTASQTFGSSENSDGDRKLVKGTLGNGANANIVLGAMLNTNVGLEMGVSYLFGATTKTNYDSYGYSGSDEFSARMLRISPALKISTAGEKTKLYAKAGMCFGVSGAVTYNETNSAMDYYTYSIYKTETTEEYSGGIAIGFTGALGAEFKAGNNISFFTEANIIAQSWAPSKSETTKYTVNSQDALSSHSDRETHYVTDINSSSQSNNEQFKIYLPMSSIGINIGMHFTLGGKKETK